MRVCTGWGAVCQNNTYGVGFAAARDLVAVVFAAVDVDFVAGAVDAEQNSHRRRLLLRNVQTRNKSHPELLSVVI